MDHLSILVAPFRQREQHRADPVLEQSRHQTEEAARLLRQLRAELRLMRLWRNEDHTGGASER